MDIVLKGVKQNNLNNISMTIPKNKMTVVTGVSGSGKSSLVFDVIYAEAQRQLFESIGTFSRISMPKYSKPDVDTIRGLATCFLIEQKQIANNPRSTVGTFYEVYAYIRLLFSRFGSPHLNAGDFSFNNPKGSCQKCKGTGKEIRVDLNKLLDRNLSLSEGAIKHRRYKKNSREYNILSAIQLFDMNKKIRDYTEEEMQTLLYSPPIPFKNEAMGFVQGFRFEGVVNRILGRATDSRGLPGVGYDSLFTYETTCTECKNSRLNKTAREVLYHNKTIIDMVTMEVKELLAFFQTVMQSEHETASDSILDFIIRMLNVLVELGLGYLTLSRPIGSLSNGEAQRIKLAKQLGTSLSDIIYIFDEPTSGLHAKDVGTIINTIKTLVSDSNTAIIVEHNKDVIKQADHILELGPFAGQQGGNIVFQGSCKELLEQNTITSRYLRRGKTLQQNTVRQPQGFVRIQANRNNLDHISVDIPMRVMCCITGVSGSGKSSLLQEIARHLDNCVVINQSRIGTNVRSNTVTYVDVFTDIRKEFAKHTNVDASLFAFNSKGACSVCKGTGYIDVNMHFLGDVRTVCDECNGRRYTAEVLQYKYQGRSIAEVLEMTVDEAVEFFDKKEIVDKLNILSRVGLGYLTLGQSFDTLSGGEAQRVRLAGGLSKKGSIFLLDEPSRGLHMYDVDNLLQVLDMIIENGNTVIMVEHNMDLIKASDYVIDMGPGAGKLGGKVVAAGTPIEIVSCASSITGRYMNEA